MSDNRFIRLSAMIISALCLMYCYVTLQWTPVELVRFVVGIFILWFPVAAIVYALLNKEVESASIRFTLSLLASYTLTTLLYFGLAVFGLSAAFYAIQGIIIVGVVLYGLRKRSVIRRVVGEFRLARVNWLLVLIIASSLAVCVRYNVYVTIDDTTQARTYTFVGDQLYSAALSYELARYVPPHQAMTAGGLPERAYHMFPHLTTALIARYTGSDDMVRANMVYYYFVIEILLCLALYSIGKALTGSKITGYIGALLLYLLTIQTPPLVPNSIHYFYFTVFPNVSSGIDPAALTSPQMYASFVVCFGILLALLVIFKSAARGIPLSRLLIVVALMIGATTRFRVHLLLAMLPAFLIVMFFLGLRRRKLIYWAAAGVALTVSLLLYIEMRAPVYLAGSAGIQLGYNALTGPGTWSAGIFNSWPFATQAYNLLSSLIPGLPLRLAIWQVISLPMFTLLNIIGIPLLAATYYFYSQRKYHFDFSLYKQYLFVTLLVSTIISLTLSMDYDSYSVPGQLTYHTRWYLLPFAGVAFHALLTRLQRRVKWTEQQWIVSAAIAVLLVQGAVQWSAPSEVQKVLNAERATLSSSNYNAFLYIRANTPPDSVILTRAYLHNGGELNYAVGGLGGRAAYVESSVVNTYATTLYHQDRNTLVNNLWSDTDASVFCESLTTTPVTHLIIEQADPLKLVTMPTCLHQIWQSDNHATVIWQVIR